MAEDLSKIAQILINNEELSNTVERNIKIIMKDGKIDAYDIPVIINIVTECYNKCGKNKVTSDDLPDLLKEIINYIFKKYNVVPNNQEQKFTDMIDTVITLIMLKPKIKKKCFKIKNVLCKK